MQITKEITVAEIVSKKLGSDHVFSKYKIDFCCGGGITLEAACKESKVEFEVIKQEIEAVNNKISGKSSLSDLDINSLIDLAKNDYQPYISDTIFEILPFSKKVAEVHGEQHKELEEINLLVFGIETVLTEMLKNSVESLYPAIKEISCLNNLTSNSAIQQLHLFHRSIKRNEIAQILISDTFKEISILSSNYNVPAGGCNSYKFLYEKLNELEHKLHKYIHLEKNVIIPEVLKIIE